MGAVPPELGRLTALKELQLLFAGVKSLPDSISQLTALQELNLRHNDVPLEIITSALGGLTGLTKLVLVATGLETLP